MHDLSENKLAHIRTVARVCYDTSVACGLTEEAALDMALLAYVHDIGYLIGAENHSKTGAALLKRNGYKNWQAVANHGEGTAPYDFETLLLWHADMSCDHAGNRCDYETRLAGIRSRYGEASSQYQNACLIVEMLKKKFCPQELRALSKGDSYGQSEQSHS